MTLIEFLNAFWEFITSSSWALPTAVIVYVAQKFVVPQTLEYREIIKRARYALVYYGNIFPLKKEITKGEVMNREELEKTSKELRVISARVRAHRDNILGYKWVARLGLVPSWENTERIATGFMGWSNEIFTTEPGQSGRQHHRKQIAEGLSMKL